MPTTQCVRVRAKLVLFSFQGAEDAAYYCMEAACPHLGAPLEHAALEERGEAGDLEDTVVVWYVY